MKKNKHSQNKPNLMGNTVKIVLKASYQFLLRYLLYFGYGVVKMHSRVASSCGSWMVEKQVDTR